MMVSRAASLGISLATNLFMVGLFCRALTHPAMFAEFIYKTGIIIFVIEFMSLHSSGMLLGSAATKRKSGQTPFPAKGRFVLLPFYILMVGVFAAAIVMLLVSTFVVIFSAKFLADWFPLPAEVRAARPPDTSGLFVDTPQTLMAWGALYFSLMTVFEVLIYRKHGEKGS